MTFGAGEKCTEPRTRVPPSSFLPVFLRNGVWQTLWKTQGKMCYPHNAYSQQVAIPLAETPEKPTPLCSAASETSGTSHPHTAPGLSQGNQMGELWQFSQLFTLGTFSFRCLCVFHKILLTTSVGGRVRRRTASQVNYHFPRRKPRT